MNWLKKFWRWNDIEIFEVRQEPGNIYVGSGGSGGIVPGQKVGEDNIPALFDPNECTPPTIYKKESFDARTKIHEAWLKSIDYDAIERMVMGNRLKIGAAGEDIKCGDIVTIDYATGIVMVAKAGE